MPLAFYRLGDKAFICLVSSAFIAFFLAYIPNYQKWAYERTIPIAYDKSSDHSGYPEGGGYPEVHSIEEIKQHNNFIIRIDVADLEPVDVYESICSDGYSTNKRWRIFSPDEEGGIGRYFIAKLESGEKVVLLLDDTVLDFPKSGIMTLPVGKVNKGYYEKVLNEVYARAEVDEESKNWYINMAEAWRKGRESKKMQGKQGNILVAAFIICMLLEVIVYKIVVGIRRK